MKLRPAGVPSASDINRATLSSASVGKTDGFPEDGIRISTEFETLGLLQASHITKAARAADAVRSGAYQVDAAAVSKSIVEDALR